jgi:hypothetical protein
MLRCAGYLTTCTGSLSHAIFLSAGFDPDLIIVGHTFSDLEQEAFVEELHESQPGMRVLCLKFGLMDPAILLRECKLILSAQPSCANVRLLQAS